MSRLTEYINLAIKGLPYSLEILQSVITDVQLKHNTLSEDKKAEIIRRRVICATCPFMSENTKSSQEYKKLTGKEYSSSRVTPHCSFCGCPISTRTAGLSSNCGIEVWNGQNSEQQIPLKWSKYENKDITNSSPQPISDPL
jgi:hypothetical protein